VKLSLVDGGLGYEAEVNAQVAALDLDGDGRDELFVASARELAALRLGPGRDEVAVTWRAPSEGGATAVTTGDLDGDGRRDLVVGWGAHRDHRDAPARLVAYLTGGAPRGGLVARELAAPETSRAQFASLQVTRLEPDGPVGLLVAWYASQYEVEAAFGVLGASFDERLLGRIRMASEWRAGRLRRDDLASSMVVGRPYGDAPRSDGDVFVLGRDGSRERIPSFRGVRSLIVVPGELLGRDRAEVCFGDGWHWRYKDEGRGMVTCATPRTDGGFESKVVARFPDYSIENLALADLDGDGRPELIAQGASGLYAIALPEPGGRERWRARRIGPGGSGFTAIDVSGDGRSALALAGERPALLRPDDLNRPPTGPAPPDDRAPPGSDGRLPGAATPPSPTPPAGG